MGFCEFCCIHYSSQDIYNTEHLVDFIITLYWNNICFSFILSNVLLSGSTQCGCKRLFGIPYSLRQELSNDLWLNLETNMDEYWIFFEKWSSIEIFTQVCTAQPQLALMDIQRTKLSQFWNVESRNLLKRIDITHSKNIGQNNNKQQHILLEIATAYLQFQRVPKVLRFKTKIYAPTC